MQRVQTFDHHVEERQVGCQHPQHEDQEISVRLFSRTEQLLSLRVVEHELQ